MNHLSSWNRMFGLSLLLLCSTFVNVIVVVVANDDEEELRTRMQPKDHADAAEDEEWRLVQETIAAGRGDRDEPGVRDQWESTEHLQDKYDIRKPISAKVQGLLDTYRLTCPGCSEKEAVAKINAFVLETKQKAQEASRRSSMRERAVTVLVTILALGAAAGAYRHTTTVGGLGNSHTLGGGGRRRGGGGAAGEARRREIEEQRRRAAKRQQEAQEMAALTRDAPTWRNQEEREIWTPKQEKQFAKALVSFGGVPVKKARYTLIADKVDGKNRQECLMHHKLLQVMAKEKEEGTS